MGDVRTSFANVAVHLPHDTDMLVAVEQRVLLVATGAIATARGAVGFQTGMGENDDQTLGLFVMGGDGHMLLGDELRQLRRRTGLGP